MGAVICMQLFAPLCAACPPSSFALLRLSVPQLQSTIREHRDGGNAGGVFSRYNILKVRMAWLNLH